MQIVLLRHGRPSFKLKGLVRAKDLGEIARSYDLAGIVDVPPDEAGDLFESNCFVVCSHLERSVQSAKALGCTRIHHQDMLFGETAIPHFHGGSITLPIGVWVVVLRVLWLFGLSRNGESLVNARRRAAKAAERLAEFAVEHGAVLLVGHGFMNRLIARELKRRGWAGPSKPGKAYWSYAVYEMHSG